MAMINVVKSTYGLWPSMRENPPISFVPKVKKLNFDGVEADKTEFIKLKFFIDPKNQHPVIPSSLLFLRIEDLDIP
jgi:hypothetical protein